MIDTMMLKATVEQNDIITDHSSFAQLGLAKPGEKRMGKLLHKRERKIILQTQMQPFRWNGYSHQTMGLIEERNKAVLCKSDFFF